MLQKKAKGACFRERRGEELEGGPATGSDGCQQRRTVEGLLTDYWITWAGPPRTFSLDLDSGLGDMCYDIGPTGSTAWSRGTTTGYGRRSGTSRWKTTPRRRFRARRTSFGTKTLRQWVFGVNPRLPGDVVDGAEDISALSSYSIDSKLQRQNVIRQAARIAFPQVQTSEAVQRALAHKSRVRKYNFEPRAW